DHEHHAAAAPGLLVDVVDGRRDPDGVARPDRNPELDVLARVEAHATEQLVRQIVGEELVALERHAERRMCDEIGARLRVEVRGLPESAREGNQLLGRHRLREDTVELLPEYAAIERECHSRTAKLGHRHGWGKRTCAPHGEPRLTCGTRSEKLWPCR